LNNRRRYRRVPGPFDARRVDLLPVPLRIYDISEGGCLIQSHQEQPLGQRFWLEIELPVEGWLRLEAQVLYNLDGWFAVAFVEMPDAVRAPLARAIAALA